MLRQARAVALRNRRTLPRRTHTSLPLCRAPATAAIKRHTSTKTSAWPAFLAPVVARVTDGAGLGELQRLKDAVNAAETAHEDAVAQRADALRAHMADANGAILEILVMDARGLNVAASGVTSDYWQGDEAKFTQTYPLGPDAMHHGEVAFDESSQAYQAQVSFTISDPKTGRPIGAMTVGLNAELLM